MSALARLDQIGAMTTADLARAESVKPQSMGTVLASLEQEGLVSAGLIRRMAGRSCLH